MTDPIRVIESAYATSGAAENEWLEQLAPSIAANLPSFAGTTPAYTYDVRDDVAIRSSTGPLRRRDASEAVEIGRGLVACRWSLVDRFESDGRRFLIAHRTIPRRAIRAAAPSAKGKSSATRSSGDRTSGSPRSSACRRAPSVQ